MGGFHDNLFAIVCTLCVLIPGASGQDFGNTSLAGIVAGAVVGGGLLISIVVMCALIVMKSNNSHPLSKGYGKQIPQLNPAPDTVSYNQRRRPSQFPRPQHQSMTDLRSPFVGNQGSQFIGDQGANFGMMSLQDSAWANDYQSGQMITSTEQVQIQNLGLDPYNEAAYM